MIGSSSGGTSSAFQSWKKTSRLRCHTRNEWRPGMATPSRGSAPHSRVPGWGAAAVGVVGATSVVIGVLATPPARGRSA